MRDPLEPAVPFRWDLVTPEQLGSLLENTEPPDLWFAAPLAECAGKVLSRSGGGDLFFVGRSLDSMFDLLGGALSLVRDAPGLHRLPFSFQRPPVRTRTRRWQYRPLGPAEVAHARAVLASVGLTPQSLSRLARPVAFVDVVHGGRTFTELYTLIRDWTEEEAQPWSVIRKKVRFVGVTSRTKTSPNTFRWQQHAEWTDQLPARSVVNVSLSPRVWSYLGDHQVKLTRSHRPERWLADAEGPARDDRTRHALAEAVAVVEFGRSPQGRQLIAASMFGEPALRQTRLRSLQADLNTSAGR